MVYLFVLQMGQMQGGLKWLLYVFAENKVEH